MFFGIQLLGIIFGIIMIYVSFYYYKRNSYSIKSFILWLAVWIGFMFVIITPSTFYGVMELLEIQRTQDFLVVMGLLFYGVLIFYLYASVKQSNRKVEKLVRTMAMRNASTKTVKRKKR